MKKIWMAQPANKKGSNSVYLPYSIASIAAYVWQKEDIQSAYALQDFIFLIEDIDSVLGKIESPYLFALSCYMWNVNYNLALAKAVKEKYPSCIIVFGGPDVPEDESFLKQYPFIDYLIFGEGEEPFCRLLKALLSEADVSDVPNLAYRSGEHILTNSIFAPKDIENYPSPYLEGYFEHILNNDKYKDLKFDVVLETNRGCPYKCLYCSWGAKTAPIRKFSMQRIKGELEWICKHKIEYCICADGNFGFFERDEEIARYLISLKKIYGYPITFETAADKNKNDFVFQINKQLNEADLNRGVSLACQSLSPQVLKIVHRVNLSLEEYARQIKLYRDAGISTYTDLIIGLPGETCESFSEGLFHIIELGQYMLHGYLCELLPCSPMADPAVIQKYGIHTIKSSLCEPHTNIHTENKYGARSEIVVQTNTMSTDDWIKMIKIFIYTHTFHGFGVLRYIAVYLRRGRQIPYRDFYMALFEYMERDTEYFGEMIHRVIRSLFDFLDHGEPIHYFDTRFGDIYWEFEEGLFNNIAADKEAFYSHIQPFLSDYFDNESLFEDLLKYQKSKTAFPYEREHSESFLYDWEEYFSDSYNSTQKYPCKCKTTVFFETHYYDTLPDFARDIVWLGKRRGYTIVESKKK